MKSTSWIRDKVQNYGNDRMEIKWMMNELKKELDKKESQMKKDCLFKIQTKGRWNKKG